jgi:hypothetical protein
MERRSTREDKEVAQTSDKRKKGSKENAESKKGSFKIPQS